MQVTFLGGADEVGASAYLIDTGGRRVLVDCGMRMGGASVDPLPDLRAVQDSGGLDAIVITHAHLDHTGALPVIHAAFPDAPVFATEPTWALLRVLLLDAVKIMGDRLDREGELPLYSQEAVEGLLARATATRFLEPIELPGGGLTVTAIPAGHVLGASGVVLEGGSGRVLVTGDVSVTDQLTVPGMLPPRLRPELVIAESTYGDRLHASRTAEEQRLVQNVSEVIENGGKVLIPAFALGRAQEVLLLLKRAFKRGRVKPFPVWVDGMVRPICEVYAAFPEWVTPWLRRQIERQANPFYDSAGPVQAVTKPSQRAELVAGPPCCIVTSSGMLSGGPSQQYAALLAGDPRNLIAITGYQDEEAPGRALLDLAEGRSADLRLGGVTVPVQCRVARHSLSAHADRQQMTSLIDTLRPRDVALVHGDKTARATLAQSVAPHVRDEVYLPAAGDRLTFLYRHPRPRPPAQVLPGFGSGRTPDEAAAGEFARLLEAAVPGARAHDLRELAERWTGKPGGGDSAFRESLRVAISRPGSPFVADFKRPFLFRLASTLPREASFPLRVEASSPGAWAAQQQDGCLDQKAAVARTEALLPPSTGLYRKGVHLEEHRLELWFLFPAVAAKVHGGVIERLGRETGWTVTIHPEVQLSALIDRALSALPKDWGVSRSPSWHREQTRLVLSLGEVPPDWREQTARIAAGFEEETGVRLELERSEVAAGPPVVRDESGRLEINQALGAIDRLFAAAPHRPSRKSRKTDASGAYLEISFISPRIAARYSAQLEQASRETGWRVAASPRTDQDAILRVFRELWPADWRLLKGPGLHVAQSALQVMVATRPAPEALEPLAARFLETTGFDLVVKTS